MLNKFAKKVSRLYSQVSRSIFLVSSFCFASTYKTLQYYLYPIISVSYIYYVNIDKQTFCCSPVISSIIGSYPRACQQQHQVLLVSAFCRALLAPLKFKNPTLHQTCKFMCIHLLRSMCAIMSFLHPTTAWRSRPGHPIASP